MRASEEQLRRQEVVPPSPEWSSFQADSGADISQAIAEAAASERAELAEAHASKAKQQCAAMELQLAALEDGRQTALAEADSLRMRSCKGVVRHSDILVISLRVHSCSARTFSFNFHWSMGTQVPCEEALPATMPLGDFYSAVLLVVHQRAWTSADSSRVSRPGPFSGAGCDAL